MEAYYDVSDRIWWSLCDISQILKGRNTKKNENFPTEFCLRLLPKQSAFYDRKDLAYYIGDQPWVRV